MNQLTVRGFDDDVEREIEQLAEAENISLSKAAVRLLRKGAGLDDDRLTGTERIGSSLDHLAGTWSEADCRAFGKVERDFERIDRELWS